jgi:hypothetical protein
MVLAFAAPGVAAAQAPASGRSTRPPRHESRWEIGLHAGVFTAGVPEQGLTTLPAANPAFTTVNGNFSRRVPTWFFGDGATLFSTAVSTLANGARIATLDGVAAGPSGNPGNGWTAGGRVGRAMNPRVSVEGTFEYSRSQLRLRATAVDAIEAARASFVTAWTALFATDPGTFQNTTVAATSAVDAGSTHQIVANGAIVFNILTHRRNTPYTSVAVGILSNGGRAPSVTLAGHYTARLNGTAPIDETDTMTLRYNIDRTLVAVSVGLGMKHMVTDQWGLRVEMREQLCSNPLTNLVSASPAVALSSNASQQGAAATPLASSLQFANIPNSATRSSLGGSLAGAKVFTGTGMESRFSLTGGMFWRF